MRYKSDVYRHRLVLCLAILIPLGGPSASFAATPPKVACVSNTTGAVALRVKCKKGETTFAASTYTTPLNNLTASLADSNTKITTLTSGLQSTDGVVAALSSTVNGQAASLATLTPGLASATSNISTLTSGLATTNSNVSSLTSGLASTDANVASLTSGLATTNTNLSSLLTGLTTTNSNVSTLISGLATTDSTAASLASTVSGQATSISGLLSSVSAANTAISTLQTSVGTIEATLSPGRVYYVAPGGPVSSIGFAIAAAQNDGADADNRAVIYLAPGTYSVTSRITVSPGISLVGSGTFATVLVNANDDGVLRMQNDSSISNLGIVDNRAASPRTVSIDTANSVVLKDVYMEIAEDNDGFAIDVEDSSVTIDRVTIRYFSSGTSTVPLRFSGSNVEATQLQILALFNPTITAIRILSTGSISLRNTQIVIASQTTAATGISNEGAATLALENSSLAIGGGGGGTAVGIIASAGGTTVVRNSSVTCSVNGPSDIGCVHGTGVGTSVNVVHSTIQANNMPNETVVSADSATVTARFSELLDGYTLNVTSGTLTCYGVVNPSYTTDFYGNTCFPD